MTLYFKTFWRNWDPLSSIPHSISFHSSGAPHKQTTRALEILSFRPPIFTSALLACVQNNYILYDFFLYYSQNKAAPGALWPRARPMFTYVWRNWLSLGPGRSPECVRSAWVPKVSSLMGDPQVQNQPPVDLLPQWQTAPTLPTRFHRGSRARLVDQWVLLK